MSGNRKIIMYAITRNGDGFVEKIGEYRDLDEIRIRIGMFDKDVVITLQEKFEENESSID